MPIYLHLYMLYKCKKNVIKQIFFSKKKCLKTIVSFDQSCYHIVYFLKMIFSPSQSCNLKCCKLCKLAGTKTQVIEMHCKVLGQTTCGDIHCSCRGKLHWIVKQALSQNLETGCPKIGNCKIFGHPNVKGGHNIV